MQTEPGLSTQLQAGISGPQSSLAGAQRAQDALKFYLISLGILGLPGLIAMAILISQTQDQVNALQAQIKCLERQRQQQQSFSDQTRQFSGGLSDLINKVGKMGNSLQILSGDLGNVINDLDQRHLPAVRVFLTAASMEINPPAQRRILTLPGPALAGRPITSARNRANVYFNGAANSAAWTPP